MLSRFALIVAVALTAFAAFSADANAGHSNKSDSRKTSKSYHNKKKSGFSFRIQIGNSNRHHHNQRKYVRGHWETRRVRYCVSQACYKVVTYPAVYEVRYDDCGKPYRVMVRPETRRRVYYPAKYGYRTVRHYVPGRWVTCSR